MTSRTSTEHGDFYHSNSNYGSSNSLLFRSVFYRYLKKRRTLLVLLLCVILISLSYLFVVSGGLQFKRHKIGKELLSVPRVPYDEIIDTEEVSIQYNKLTRLNKSIQKVISYGKISLLNGEDQSKSNFLKNDNDVNSDIKKSANDRYQMRRRNGRMVSLSRLLNLTKPDNNFIMNPHQIDAKNNTQHSKLNYEDEKNHSNQ